MSSLVGKTILNRYFVQEFIGRGGMAEVYKVWDNQRMTYLAMKVLLEDLALDRVFIRRFTREANTLQRLQHPNIVRFFGFEKDGRSAFMLMDYIEGETLKHFIHDAAGKSMRYGQIRVITRSICGALHYAHSQGLVHCDIKPANIMVKQNGTVQLADFGISRMSDAATATMVGAGTPAYMAPEQILGKEPLPQTDIYALGVVLYEMFTGGERPFTGENAESKGGMSDKVRWEHLNLAPPSPKEWNSSLSSEVEAVILKCLSKDPAERYQTSLELFNALERALGDIEDEKPIIRPQNPRPKPRRKPVFTFRKELAWLLPVALILLAGTIFLLEKGNSPVSTPLPIGQIALTQSDDSDYAEVPESAMPPNTAVPTKTVIPHHTSTPAPSPTITPMSASHLGSVYTKTVEPSRKSIPADYECADSAQLDLYVGAWARTARYNMSIYEEILDEWDASIEGIRALPKKERILVYDGPICSESGQTWWFVKTESSQFGWVIEYARGGYGHFFTVMK